MVVFFLKAKLKLITVCMEIPENYSKKVQFILCRSVSVV